MNRDYVAVWAASALLGRKHRTIRTWVRQRRVDAARHPHTGELMVDRVDVLREHERAATRRRTPQV